MNNDWHFKLSRRLVDRESVIIELCRHKRVLHLGFLDYPIFNYRIESGTWLHGKLMNVAKEVFGIDNVEEEIERIKREYGIENIFYGNAEDLSTFDFQPFDVIIAGEIIEHLNNPGLFLQGIKPLIADNGKIFVSTTNAYCLRRFIRIPFGIESIHPDHKYYFSHSTLTRHLEANNYKIIERYNYRLPRRPPWFPYIVELIASYMSPNLTEGIIYIVSK